MEYLCHRSVLWSIRFREHLTERNSLEYPCSRTHNRSILWSIRVTHMFSGVFVLSITCLDDSCSGAPNQSILCIRGPEHKADQFSAVFVLPINSMGYSCYRSILWSIRFREHLTERNFLEYPCSRTHNRSILWSIRVTHMFSGVFVLSITSLDDLCSGAPNQSILCIRGPEHKADQFSAVFALPINSMGYSCYRSILWSIRVWGLTARDPL
jgi:hypothetical protein